MNLKTMALGAAIAAKSVTGYVIAHPRPTHGETFEYKTNTLMEEFKELYRPMQETADSGTPWAVGEVLGVGTFIVGLWRKK